MIYKAKSELIELKGEPDIPILLVLITLPAKMNFQSVYFGFLYL